MQDIASTLDSELTLDANSVGGLLWDIFGVEMTAEPTECAHCGFHGEVGTLIAYTQGPGITLRCSTCGQIVLRIVQLPNAIYLDARGAVFLRVKR